MRQHKVSSHAPQEGPPDLGLTDAAAVGKEVCSWRGWKTVLSSSWLKISDILKCLDTRSLILLAGNIIWFGLWCDTSTMLILIKAVTQTVVILVLRLYIFHVQPAVIIVVPLPRIATIKLWQWWEYKNRALDAEKQCWAVLDWRYLTSWNAWTLEVWFC